MAFGGRNLNLEAAMIKQTAAILVVLASSTFAFGGTPKYELKRINMGPRTCSSACPIVSGLSDRSL